MAVSRFLFPAMLLSLALVAIVTLWHPTGPHGVAPALPGPSLGPASPPPDGVVIIRLRDAAKQRVVDQLLAGELDLFAAAAHFRQINHEPPELRQLGYRLLPGRTDEEKLCREIITWVKFRHPRHTTHAEAMRTVADLEGVLASRESVESATIGKSVEGPRTRGAGRADKGNPMGEPMVPATATPG